MAISPVQPVAAAASLPLPVDVVARLWRESDASLCGLTQVEFCEALARIGERHHYGLPAEASISPERRRQFLEGLKLQDLALAQACALGKEAAWTRFLALYRGPLTRAAVAIAGSETVGRDLADALYAELYGLTERDGVRRSPLASYSGRGSLMGWLRTTLAQRHVDHHRRHHREAPLEDYDAPMPVPEAKSPAELPVGLSVLGSAIQKCVVQLSLEERFLLASYYLDERTLLQIARILHVHEATVSRKLRRLVDDLRKQVLRELQRGGLSKRAAEEALGADPRDLDLNLKRLLQDSEPATFQERKGDR